MRTLFASVASVSVCVLLYAQSAKVDVRTTTLNFGERCEQSIFGKDSYLGEDQQVEKVLELIVQGQDIGNLSLLLPVRYGQRLQALANSGKSYIGAECYLTEIGNGCVELRGRVLFSAFEDGERRELA